MVARINKKRKFLGFRGLIAKSLFWLLSFVLTFSLTINLGYTLTPQPTPYQYPPTKLLQEWQLKGIMAALDDGDFEIWRLALNKLSEFKIDQLKNPLFKYERIVELLSDDKNPDVQEAAARVLGRMGETAALQVPQLLKLLETSNNPDVQWAAAEALGEMGEAAASQAPQLAKLLETSNNPDRQWAAARALAGMGEAAASQASQLIKFLKTSNTRRIAYEKKSVQQETIGALAMMGEAAASQAPQLAKLLENFNDPDIQRGAVLALEKMGKADIETILSILNAVYGTKSQIAQYRFLTYFLSDAKEESIIAIKWLGLPQEYPDLTKQDRKQVIKILQFFDRTWQPSQSLSRLRNDLEKQIAKIIKQGKLKFQDIALLTKHYQHLQSVNSTHADAIKAKIGQLKGWKRLFEFRSKILPVLPVHAIFWLVLILVYPKYRPIQAMFFWSPRIRKIFGLGYVSLLITWIPYFRSRLFIPFTERLLAEAQLNYSDLQFYFDKSQVKHEACGEIKQLKDAIPEIKGQIILQGESGLGKTLFLRHLAKNSQGISQRIVVYLPAERCTNGVIEAIQSKLKGKIKDFKYLRDLIYSGAIDICIDGLNEVNPDTRASIKKFVEEYFKGNIIMTTQPLEWKPPATASIYSLQPLEEDLIKEFLLSRQSYLTKNDLLKIQNYPQACQNYIAKALDKSLSSQELIAIKKVLSNPMDLTILGQIIASGEEPDLFKLQKQQYELMAAKYKIINRQEFPLTQFSKHAYQIRLEDNSTIDKKKFYKELQRMLKYKMVICQKIRDANDKNVEEWKFRHEKIWDYFISLTFLNWDDKSLHKHTKDSRFHGVYILLANSLPLERANKLEKHLHREAARSKDHTLSDSYILQLENRNE